MDGYKIVYSEPDGTITDIVKLMFSNAYPNCKIISIERCTPEEFTK